MHYSWQTSRQPENKVSVWSTIVFVDALTHIACRKVCYLIGSVLDDQPHLNCNNQWPSQKANHTFGGTESQFDKIGIWFKGHGLNFFLEICVLRQSMKFQPMTSTQRAHLPSSAVKLCLNAYRIACSLQSSSHMEDKPLVGQRINKGIMERWGKDPKTIEIVCWWANIRGTGFSW